MSAAPVERCPWGDLPVLTCACQHCRPHIPTPAFDGQLAVVPGYGAGLDQADDTLRVVSRWHTDHQLVCDKGGERIVVGEVVAKLSDGDWVCEGCLP